MQKRTEKLENLPPPESSAIGGHTNLIDKKFGLKTVISICQVSTKLSKFQYKRPAFITLRAPGFGQSKVALLNLTDSPTTDLDVFEDVRGPM